jgi:hypothetical protein
MRTTFDRYAFDSERRELLRDGESIHLPPKAYRLLEILIESAPRALSKQALCESIWPQTFVEESSLAGLVNDLRSALGDRHTRAGTIIFRGQELPLHDGVNVLGRDGTCDVQIDDPTVSRSHATITLEKTSTTIEDLASKNGTFLDGVQLIGTAPLAEGQTIVLGDARLVFRRTLTSASTVSVMQKPGVAT